MVAYLVNVHPFGPHDMGTGKVPHAHVGGFDGQSNHTDAARIIVKDMRYVTHDLLLVLLCT